MSCRHTLLAVAALACVGAGSATKQSESPRSASSAPPHGALSYLEVNRGQSDRSVDFLVRCGSYMAWIRATDVVLSLSAPRAIEPLARRTPPRESAPAAVVAMRLVGAASRPARAGDVLPGASNYMIGRDESRWVLGVPHVRTARYDDAWPGVGVVWKMDARRLRADFEVAAGADPAGIALAFDGAGKVAVDGGGSLRIATEHGDAVFSAPVAFQSGGRRVDVKWRVRDDGAAVFDLGAWDRSQALTIDPTLTYGTFLGGSAREVPGGVAVDSSNNVYMGGTTESSNLPVTSGVYQSSIHGGQDAYCIKLNASGSTLGYCTYVGGSSAEIGTGLAVDGSGNAFIAGYTGSTDFPVTSGAAVTNNPSTGQYMGYVVKLNASGSARVYATYIAVGYCWALAIDSSGAAYVTIESTQIYVHKVNASGTAIAYTTSYGVTNATQTRPVAIAVDSSNNAYVAGYTEKTSFPTTTGAYRTTYVGGSRDAFLFKLNSSGNVAWSTLLGGTDEDEAWGLTLDGSGDPWVVGHTKSTDFPVVSPYQQNRAADQDAFVTKVDSGGASLGFSTYLGGNSSDYAFAAAARGAFVYVGGITWSTDFPTSSAYQSQLGGNNQDAFVSVIRCDGTLQSSTYLGGSSYDYLEPQCLAADSAGDAYACCRTGSSDFPTQNAYDTTVNGEDGALAKLTGLFTPFVLTTASLPDWTQGIPFGQTLATSGAAGTVTWSITAGSPPNGFTLSSAGTLSGTPTAAGTYTFTVRAVDSCQQVAQRQLSLLVNPPPAITAVAPQKWTRTRPFSLPLATTGGTAPLAISVDSGTVPPGLQLSSGGLLSGTPTDTGSYSFEARVTDLRGAAATRTITMDVAEVPSITTTSIADCTQQVEYAKTFTAIDGTPPLVWSLADGSWPFSKPIDAATGAVDAITKVTGTYTFTLRVTDAAGATADRELTLLLNPSPQIDTASLPLAVSGRAYNATLEGHGGTPPVKWHLRSLLPFGLGIGQDSGVLSGTPTVPGATGVRFGYDDACGGVFEQSIRMDVAQPFDLQRRKAKASIDFDEQVRKDPQFFALELFERTTLGVIVKANTKGDLPVDVALLGPSGNVIDVAGFGAVEGRSYKLSGFVVPASGRYFLRVSPLQPFAGKVTTSVTVAPASSFGTAIHLDSAQPPTDLRIPVLADALLTVTVKGVKGGTVVPAIVSIMQNGAELLVPSQVKGSGSTRTLKLAVPLAAGEVHVFLGAAPGTSGDATWSIKLKQPRTYNFSMANVPAGD